MEIPILHTDFCQNFDYFHSASQECSWVSKSNIGGGEVKKSKYKHKWLLLPY